MENMYLNVLKSIKSPGTYMVMSGSTVILRDIKTRSVAVRRAIGLANAHNQSCKDAPRMFDRYAVVISEHSK